MDIGGWTALVAIATSVYGGVAIVLLVMNMRSFKQSRAAFLADMVVRMLSLEDRAMQNFSFPKSLYRDMVEMLGNVDPSLKRDFVKAVEGSKSKKGK